MSLGAIGIDQVNEKTLQEISMLYIPIGGATITNPDTAKAESPDAATHAPYEYLANDTVLPQAQPCVPTNLSSIERLL